MTKSRAYTTESDFEKITAWAVMQERMKYGGQPLRKTYWSTHVPGLRKPVKHVLKAGTAFFAYINGADEVGGNGEGESLTHQLFKEAIAGLAGTKLKLGIFGEHDITITHGETEKEIRTAEGTYYADAYLRFTSTTSLGLKWSGEMYVEVHHTHAVPPHKQDSLRQARLPVVEIDVPTILEYPHEDEDTTDPREATHVNKIRNMLQKGFLAGRVISDRSSVEYLEQEVDRLKNALNQAEKGWSEANRRGDAALQQLKAASEREASLKNTVGDLIQQAKKDANIFTEWRSKFSTETDKSRTMSKSLSDANATIAAQRKEIRFFN